MNVMDYSIIVGIADSNQLNVEFGQMNENGKSMLVIPSKKVSLNSIPWRDSRVGG
jgi:hypothetical protein